MYVCICNGLTEGRVKQAANSGRRTDCPKEAYRRLGCRPQCGLCLTFAREILSEEQAESLQGLKPIAI